MSPMDDPFVEGRGRQPAPKTPSSSYGFLKSHTPSKDPFASFTSPQQLRVLLKESEGMRKSIQKDLELAQAKIKYRDDEIVRLQDENQAMRTRIGQQEITIKNQSKAIEDPRSLRMRRAMGPLDVQTAISQSWLTPPQSANTYVPVLPLTLYAPQSPTAGQTGRMQHGLPHVHPTSSPLHNQGAITQYINHQAVPQILMQHGSDGAIVPMMRSVSQLTGEPLQQGPLTGIPLCGPASGTFSTDPVSAFEAQATAFGIRFRTVFTNSIQFANSYGMNFKEVTPMDIDNTLSEYLMLDCDVDVAMKYLNNSLLRPMYVAQAINLYLCKRFLKHAEIVYGFDDDVDAKIATLRSMIAHDTPPMARHSILQKIAEQVKSVQQRPDFEKFCKTRLEAHGEELRRTIDPFLVVDGTERYHPIIELLKDAQQLAIDLYSCPFEVKIHFPEIGQAFDSSCMVLVGSNGSSDASHGSARTKMSVIPSVLLQLNQADQLHVRTISHAHVFTGLPANIYTLGRH